MGWRVLTTFAKPPRGPGQRYVAALGAGPDGRPRKPSRTDEALRSSAGPGRPARLPKASAISCDTMPEDEQPGPNHPEVPENVENSRKVRRQADHTAAIPASTFGSLSRCHKHSDGNDVRRRLSTAATAEISSSICKVCTAESQLVAYPEPGKDTGSMAEVGCELVHLERHLPRLCMPVGPSVSLCSRADRHEVPKELGRCSAGEEGALDTEAALDCSHVTIIN